MVATASALRISTLLLCYVAAVVAKTSECEGPEHVCAARTGAAMLQTNADKDTALAVKKGDDNLEGLAATIAAEVESLENRVSIVMTTVGLSGGAALLDKGKKPYEKYAALLHSKYDDAALKEVVTDLEAKAAAVKANVKALENEVSGTQFDAALLATASKKVESADASLTSRLFALSEVVGSLRSRVAALEEKVSLGLTQKNSSMLQVEKTSVETVSEKTSKTKGAPLKGRLATAESEITSLQERVATLETEVGASSAAALIEEGTLKGSEDKADDLKSRVAAAEANVGTLKSKLATLQNQVLGGTPPSLLQTDEDGSSLKGRIVSLEEAVNTMRTDVSSLEHTVVG